MIARLRHALPDLFAVIAGGGSIAAWQEQVEWSLKIVATLVAIAAGVASLRHHARARAKKNRAEA